MALKSTIQSDLTAALKSRDDLKLQTLRLLSSAMHNEEIAQGKELTDSEIFTIIKKEVKKRKEAIESYKAAGRNETADKEAAEMKILETYLPTQMSEVEIVAIVDEVLTGDHPQNVGQIIGMVMKKTGGNADGNLVAKIVNQKLA
jgi:uncharacterized protein YqeY